jgi:hypothetical protein
MKNSMNLMSHDAVGDRHRHPDHGHRPVLAGTAFQDAKGAVGVGQQQVRFVWANVGAFHVCLWTFTMTEAWA